MPKPARLTADGDKELESGQRRPLLMEGEVRNVARLAAAGEGKSGRGPSPQRSDDRPRGGAAYEYPSMASPGGDLSVDYTFKRMRPNKPSMTITHETTRCATGGPRHPVADSKNSGAR
jgi:hypothetical protein